MASVLPPDAKNELKRFYRMRFVYAGSLVALCTAILCICGLAPTYIALLVDEAYEVHLSLATGGSAQDKSDREGIDRARIILSAIASISATSSPSDTTEMLLGDAPPGVQVNHIHYAAGSPSTIVISSVSTGRASTEAFRKKVASEPGVVSATVPVADILNSAGGQFTLSISGTF